MADFTDPYEQLKLIRESRKGDHADLKEVIDDHFGTMATSVLITNAARLSARLIEADVNTPVDIETPADSSPAAENPTQPAAGAAL